MCSAVLLRREKDPEEKLRLGGVPGRGVLVVVLLIGLVLLVPGLGGLGLVVLVVDDGVFLEGVVRLGEQGLGRLGLRPLLPWFVGPPGGRQRC